MQVVKKLATDGYTFGAARFMIGFVQCVTVALGDM